MEHKLPELPYKKNALEPYVSAETIEYHYGKHHNTYVTNLNKLIKGTEYEGMSLEEIIKKGEKGPIFNNAAQVWNHTFYWNCFQPGGGGEPCSAFAEAIDSRVGSFESFKEALTQIEVTVLWSGWVWLVKKEDGSLCVEQTGNADNPMTSGSIPLLTCDVWEHAYYIDYRNARPKYLEAFWNIVNWEFAKKNFSSEIAGASQLSLAAQ